MRQGLATHMLPDPQGRPSRVGVTIALNERRAPNSPGFPGMSHASSAEMFSPPGSVGATTPGVIDDRDQRRGTVASVTPGAIEFREGNAMDGTGIVL
jgi:hypothetical protein